MIDYSHARHFRWPAWLLAMALAQSEVDQTLAGEPAFAVVEEHLKGMKAKSGHAPTDDDFFSIVFADNVKLTDEEFWAAWDVLKECQQPPISKEDLGSLILAKRQSIETFFVQYEVERSGRAGGDLVKKGLIDISQMLPLEPREFAMDGTKLFSRLLPHPTPEGSIRRDVHAYDGEILRTVATDDQDRSVARVTRFEGPGLFMQWDSNILAVSMLVDSQFFVGSAGIPICDLAFFLSHDQAFVQERTRSVDGDCVVVSNALFAIYLDPTRDFSVVRIVQFDIDEEARERRVRIDHQFGELKDYGNGIWLPQLVTKSWHDAGVPVGKEVIKVRSSKVNESLDPEMFVDVIPKGAVVHDHVRQLAYVSGEDGSIEHLIEGSADLGRSSSKTPFWFWMIVVNFVVLAIVLAIGLRRRRR